MKTAEFPREVVRLLIFELKTPTVQKQAVEFLLNCFYL